jgi:hypothetical protein
MEQHRLRVSGNRVLRRMCGPKGEGVAAGWRRLHSDIFIGFFAFMIKVNK